LFNSILTVFLIFNIFTLSLLGLKLRGKEIGQPLDAGPKKK